MPDVIFEEPRISQKQREEMRETSTFANWLIKVGIAKTESQAIIISLVFIVIAFVVSLVLFFSGSKKYVEPPKIMDDNFNQTL